MSDEVKDVVAVEREDDSTEDIVVVKKRKTTKTSVKNHHIVYKTTNMVNGKIYIGVHSCNSLEDGYIGNGVYSQRDADKNTSSCPFHLAVKKYGYGNFKREILYEFGSSELCFWWESYLVDEDFINRGDNYNAITGGHKSTRRLSKDSVKKLSGKTSWNVRAVRCINTGIVYSSTKDASEQTGYFNIRAVASGKRKFAGSLNGEQLRWEYVNPPPLTGEERVAWKNELRKISSRRQWKRVQCVNTGEDFACIAEASQKYGVSTSHISMCAKGLFKSAGKLPSGEKLRWKYLDALSLGTTKNNVVILRLSKKIKCINTGRIFNSVGEASHELKITNISKCLSGKVKHAGKLKDGERLSWVYIDSIKEPIVNECEVLQ